MLAPLQIFIRCGFQIVTNDFTVIVLTLNEEQNLEACLSSLKGLRCEVVVVDSGSTDRTAEIAERAASRVVVHEFETQAQQLNWALENLKLNGSWILRLDADERITPELIEELGRTASAAPLDITGFYVKRRVYFLGRWMKHGGYYPIWLLRVWRNGMARSEQRAMDEHMILTSGRSAYLKHDIEEHNKKDLFTWIDRQNRYSSREVSALLYGDETKELAPSATGGPDARRRWLKRNVYLRFPRFVRAFLFFSWRYFFRLGFLDGREGLIFHFLHACWRCFLIDAKLHEADLLDRASQ
jgi:glycosyltransferase involved in cell wall biosynthesis